MNCLNCGKELNEKKVEQIKIGSFCNEFCKKGYAVTSVMSDIEKQEGEKKSEIVYPDRREELFGKRYRECTFKNFVRVTENQEKVVTKIVKITKDIKAGTGHIIAFIGGWGTGKDHLAAAMIHYLKGNIIHTTVMKMSREIREAQKEKAHTKQQAIIDSYINCDFLIINEIGVQSITVFERNILHEIIDGHYRNMTSVLLITNEGKDEFQTCIDAPGLHRVWDRIDEKILFDWDSYREKINESNT